MRIRPAFAVLLAGMLVGLAACNQPIVQPADLTRTVTFKMNASGGSTPQEFILAHVRVEPKQPGAVLSMNGHTQDLPFDGLHENPVNGTIVLPSNAKFKLTVDMGLAEKADAQTIACEITDSDHRGGDVESYHITSKNITEHVTCTTSF